ncbi:MAG: hypothetical protein ACU0CA_04320 [Paracoccaceae bacterium]
MIRVLLVLLLSAGVARADDGADVVGAMSGICVTSLMSGAAVGPGLTRAGPATEEKILHGKIGKIWRTWNNKVVILDHASGKTCEVLGLGVTPSQFGLALESWLREGGAAYTPNKPVNFPDHKPGGIYLVTQLEDGGFIQMFIQSLPDAKYLEIIIARVAESAEARDVLGL